MTDRENGVWEILKNLGRPIMRQYDRDLIAEQDARSARALLHEAWGMAKDAPRAGDALDYDKRAWEHVQFWLEQAIAHRSNR